jgi:hypothetical protein
MDKLSESSVESDGSDKGLLSCDRKAPGAERPSPVGTLFTNNSPFPFDYEQKKKLATKGKEGLHFRTCTTVFQITLLASHYTGV